MLIRALALPPGVHGMINLLTGVISINAADPPERQLQALIHELLHDGVTRSGVRLTHDDIRAAALALATALRARNLEIKEAP